MPAAQNKSDLLAVAEKEWTKLQSVIASVPAGYAIAKDEDDTSIKDTVAHRAHWIDLFLGWYTNGRDGQTVHFPAPGYKWNQLKAYNQALRDRQTDLSWDAARTELVEAHERLIAQITALSDEDLYGAPMRGANNAWTTGRWAEAAGPSHYRSASKYIRARLKAFQA